MAMAFPCLQSNAHRSFTLGSMQPGWGCRD